VFLEEIGTQWMSWRPGKERKWEEKTLRGIKA